MCWVLSDPPSHKAGHVQKYPIIKWKWYICDRAQAGPESTSTLHEEVAQTLIVPIPTTMPFLSQLEPMTSWEVPHDQLTEEEKSQSWFTDVSADM